MDGGNTATDDAAGLAISGGMHIHRIQQATQNARDGIYFVLAMKQGATDIERALNNIILNVDRGANWTGYLEQINSIVNKTTFNGINLIDGSRENVLIQVGAKNEDINKIKINLPNLTTDGLGISENSSKEHIESTVAYIQTEIENMNIYLEMLDDVIKFNSYTVENVAASESRIRDTDMTSEMTEESESLNSARQNIKDGINIVGTALGGINYIEKDLEKMLDNKKQGKKWTYYFEMIDRIVANTTFNGKDLLKGDSNSTDGALRLSVPISADGNNKITISIKSCTANALGLSENTTDEEIEGVLNAVKEQKNTLNATLNRLNYTVENIQ